MGIAENKQAALDLLRASAVHDGPRFARLLAEDATYWTCGRPELFRAAGWKSREAICAYMHTPSIFSGGGVEVAFGAVTTEDNRVAVEAETKGTLPDGRVYTNVYHYLFTFNPDGRIASVKEYLDTQAANEFFGG